MPKRVKKASTKPKRKTQPAKDVNKRAHQMLTEHLDRLETSQKPWDDDPAPPHGDPFKEQLSAYMSKLGSKGGKASGARRMEMPEKVRKAVARKGAEARWRKKG